MTTAIPLSVSPAFAFEPFELAKLAFEPACFGLGRGRVFTGRTTRLSLRPNLAQRDPKRRSTCRARVDGSRFEELYVWASRGGKASFSGFSPPAAVCTLFAVARPVTSTSKPSRAFQAARYEDS